MPGVSTLLLNQYNVLGNWLYQTERSKTSMVDVSPEQAARFFHTVESDNDDGRLHASHRQGKWKGRGAGLPGEHGTQKAASAPSSPLKTEGPAPPKAGGSSSTPKPENPVESASVSMEVSAILRRTMRLWSHPGPGWRAIADSSRIGCTL